MGAYSDTLRLSIFFFLLFTPFSSFMTILSHIYEDAGLPGIGPATLATNYTTFIISTFCAPALKLPIKIQFLFGAIFYTVNYSSGIIVSFIDTPWLKFFISCTGAFIAGLSGGPLWVSQGRFIHLSCVKNNQLDKKGKMFGFFTTFYCFSNISAGLLTTYALGFFDTRIYFCSIAACGVISILFCIFFIPNIENTYQPIQNSQSLMQNQSNQSLTQQPQKYSPIKALKQVVSFFPKMKFLILFLVVDGVSLGYYSSQIPHLIFQQGSKSEINKLAGFLMISLGVGSTLGGITLSRISDKSSTVFLGRLSLLLTVIGCALFILTLQYKTYWLALLTSFQWGFFLFFLEGWMFVVCSKHYAGRTEAFSVNKQLHSLFYLIFQLSLLPSGNKISLIPTTIGLALVTIPAFFFINKIPENHTQQERSKTQL